MSGEWVSKRMEGYNGVLFTFVFNFFVYRCILHVCVRAYRPEVGILKAGSPAEPRAHGLPQI